MFAFTQSVERPVRIQIGTGTAEIKVRFRWLPASERMAAFAVHDSEAKAVAEAPPDQATSAQVTANAYAAAQARLIMALSDGWDLAYADGAPVPWEVDSIMAVLDWLPGLFGVLLAEAAEACSVKAVAGN